MLAPRTIHTHRSYVHPTTSKKNVNKENAHALPSKTPSRIGGKQLIGPATGIRMGLGVKTEGKDRNVLLQQVEGKGMGREMDEIGTLCLSDGGSSLTVCVVAHRA